jgi:hypothetical protein
VRAAIERAILNRSDLRLRAGGADWHVAPLRLVRRGGTLCLEARTRASGEDRAFDLGAILAAEVLPRLRAGRNDRCSCGSGMKSKRCCGA